MQLHVSHVMIAVPCPDPEKTPYYAVQEAEVDFRGDPEAARRCTLCFAATELARVLGRLGFGTRYVSSEAIPAKPDTLTLVLTAGLPAAGADDRGCGYTLRPAGHTLTLAGESRVGALYAAYAFLRLQGVRWYEPGEGGELLPPPSGTLTLPDEEVSSAPAMDFGRGLDIYAPLKASVQFLLWMARNRMNVCGYNEVTRPLAQKLGFYLRTGGHLFEPFLDPDITLPDGRTIWEAHPEWYGLPESGVRAKETALWVQFCVLRTACRTTWPAS